MRNIVCDSLIAEIVRVIGGPKPSLAEIVRVIGGPELSLAETVRVTGGPEPFITLA